MAGIAETYPPSDVSDTIALTRIPDGSSATSFTMSAPITYPPGDVNDSVTITVIHDRPEVQQASRYAWQATGTDGGTGAATLVLGQKVPNTAESAAVGASPARSYAAPQSSQRS